MKFVKRHWPTLIIIAAGAVWLGVSMGTNQCPSCVISDIARDVVSDDGIESEVEIVAQNQTQRSTEWAALDLQGNTVSHKTISGRVGILVYMTTYCGGCKKEIPDLIALREMFPRDSVALIAVSFDEAHKDLSKYADEKGINFTMVRKNDSIIEAFGRGDQMPTFFVIDKTGNEHFRHSGYMSKESLAERVRSAL